MARFAPTPPADERAYASMMTDETAASAHTSRRDDDEGHADGGEVSCRKDCGGEALEIAVLRRKASAQAADSLSLAHRQTQSSLPRTPTR
jgi:hypothetical protein